MRISAPTTAAFCSSVTRPDTVAVEVACDQAGVTLSIAKTASAHTISLEKGKEPLRILQFIPLQLLGYVVWKPSTPLQTRQGNILGRVYRGMPSESSKLF